MRLRRLVKKIKYFPFFVYLTNLHVPKEILVSKLLQAPLVMLLCVLASGCTIIPGLDVSEKDAKEGHKYHIEKSDSSGEYEVVNDDAALSMEVIKLTPEVIAAERKADHETGGNSLPTINPSVVPPEYHVGPGDVVAITVWEHPELSNPAGLTQDPSSLGRLVSADGSLFYPYVGVINAAGKTRAELRAEITRGLKGVIVDPQVDVRVTTFRALRVQVFGEVASPGVVNLDDTPKGIIEAVSERGGLTQGASRRRVVLFRKNQTYVIDFAKLLANASAEFNPVLMAGDVIQVPDQSRDQIFMLGEVAKQGPLPMMADRMSLMAAITNVGGLDQISADGSGVLVFRGPSASGRPPRVFTLSMGRPEGILLASEFDMQPRDVVYIKRTGFAKYNAVIAVLVPTINAIFQVLYIDYLQAIKP